MLDFNNKNIRILVFKLLLVLLLVILGFLVLTLLLPKQTVFSPNKELVAKSNVSMDIIVTLPPNIIVNSDKDAIHFGGAPPGSLLKAKFNITNNFNYSILVIFRVDGPMSDWVGFSNNSFVLKPEETQEILVMANIPDNATIGKYNSTLFVYEYRFFD